MKMWWVEVTLANGVRASGAVNARTETQARTLTRAALGRADVARLDVTKIGH